MNEMIISVSLLHVAVYIIYILLCIYMIVYINEMKYGLHYHSNFSFRGWIIVAKPLDRETVDRYKLTVEVNDGRHVGIHCMQASSIKSPFATCMCLYSLVMVSTKSYGPNTSIGLFFLRFTYFTEKIVWSKENKVSNRLDKRHAILMKILKPHLCP